MTYTQILIAITALLSILAFQRPRLLASWIFNPFRIRHRGEVHRFLTSGFIHANYPHLLFNMFTMFFLGEGVELYFTAIFGSLGPIYFVGLYLSAIIVSSVPTYFKHKDHEFYNSLGASGGVSALVFCFILLDPVTKLCLFGLLCLPGFILGALYLVYTIQMGRRGADNINHDAHLWGALYGLIFLIVLEPQVLGRFVSALSSFSLF